MKRYFIEFQIRYVLDNNVPVIPEVALLIVTILLQPGDCDEEDQVPELLEEFKMRSEYPDAFKAYQANELRL